jgi:hypothetical protein
MPISRTKKASEVVKKRPQSARPGGTKLDAKATKVAVTALVPQPSKTPIVTRVANPLLVSGLLNTRITSGMKKGSIVDTGNAVEYAFTKLSNGKYKIEIKGALITEANLNLLIKTLKCTKIESLTVKGRNVFLKRNQGAALAKFDTLQAGTPHNSSVSIYGISGVKTELVLEKITTNTNPQKIKLFFKGKFTRSEINTGIENLLQKGYDIQTVVTAGSLDSDARKALYSSQERPREGLTYDSDGCALLKLNTWHEIEGIPKIFSLFKNELRVSFSELGVSRDEALGNLLIKKIGGNSKDVEILIQKGGINRLGLSKFIKALEKAPLNFKVKIVSCNTDTNLGMNDPRAIKANVQNLQLIDQDLKSRILTEINNETYSSNSFAHQAFIELANQSREDFLNLMNSPSRGVEREKFIQKILLPKALDCLLNKLTRNESSFLKNSLGDTLEVILSLLGQGGHHDIFDPVYLNLRALLFSDMPESQNLSFTFVCEYLGVNTAALDHFPRRDLEAAKFSFINSAGDPVVEEQSGDINKVLDKRIHGQTFRNQAISKQELVEIATARTLREANVYLNPNSSDLRRLSKATALRMFVESRAESDPDCLGNYTISFNPFISSIMNYSGEKIGITNTLTGLNIAGKSLTFSTEGLFRGTSVTVDEFKALNFIRAVLGIEKRTRESEVYSPDDELKIQAMLNRILNGEALDSTPQEKALENLLSNLAKILEEKYFGNFKMYSTRSLIDGRENDVSLMHFKGEARNSIDALIKQELSLSAQSLVDKYPYLVRPDDYFLLNIDRVEPAVLYGNTVIDASKSLLNITRNTNLIADVAKSLAFFNLLEKANLRKITLPGNSSDQRKLKWELELEDGQIISSYTNGLNLSSPHDLSQEELGLGEKNLAIFKIKEALDRLTHKEKSSLKELITFTLTLIDENHSLDHNINRVNLSAFRRLSQEGVDSILRYRANPDRINRAKTALINARVLLKNHPLFDATTDNSAFYNNTCSTIRNADLGGSRIDSENETSVPLRLQAYMIDHLNPIEAPVIPAVPPPQRRVSLDLRMGLMTGETKKRLKALRGSGPGVKMFLDKKKKNLDQNLALNQSDLETNGFKALDHNGGNCFYTTIAQAILGVPSNATRRTPFGNKTYQIVKELENSVALYIERNLDNLLGLVTERREDYNWVSVSRQPEGTLLQRKKVALKAKAASIRRGGVWAGEVELQIMSKILGRQIHKYTGSYSFQAAVPTQIINGLSGIDNEIFTGEPLRLIFIHGCHFNWLAPKEYYNQIMQNGYL